MSPNRDPLAYYALLGVDPSASPEEIRKAYRAAAREFHPDLNPSPKATKEFQLLGRAYEVLSDESSRKEYDPLYGAPPPPQRSNPKPETPKPPPPPPPPATRPTGRKQGWVVAALAALIVLGVVIPGAYAVREEAPTTSRAQPEPHAEPPKTVMSDQTGAKNSGATIPSAQEPDRRIVTIPGTEYTASYPSTWTQDEINTDLQCLSKQVHGMSRAEVVYLALESYSANASTHGCETWRK